MSSKQIVKCKKCGTEYEMPNLDVEVVMEDCPICKELDANLKKMGLKA
jgi:rubrerythrin